MPFFAFSTSIPWSISKSLPSRSLSLWLLLVLLFHYSTHFVQHISTTGRKTASQHNATTTMSKADGAFLRLKASTLLLKNSLPLCPNNSIFLPCLTRLGLNLFFWLVHVSSCRFQSNLKMQTLGEGLSISVDTLAVHGDVKLTSLWTVTLVLQQFPVHSSFGGFRAFPEHHNPFPIIWEWQLGCSSRPLQIAFE